MVLRWTAAYGVSSLRFRSWRIPPCGVVCCCLLPSSGLGLLGVFGSLLGVSLGGIIMVGGLSSPLCCLLEVFGISLMAGGPSSLSCAMVWFGFLQSLLLRRKGNYPKGPKYLYYCIIVECPVSILGSAIMIWERISPYHGT